MADIFTPEKRSWVMSRIRGTNTEIDLRMRQLLAEERYRFEMYPKMYANPDFVLRRRRIAIFCDGDFWHGYRYREKRRLRKKFWRDKIEANMRRDLRYSRELRRRGWSALRFWEHDIDGDPDKCARRIRRKFRERGRPRPGPA